MKVLVVRGFALGETSSTADHISSVLDHRGHDVRGFDLAAEGFDHFMSAEERTAYLGDAPVVTAEAQAAIDALQAADGLVVCYPVTHRSVPPRVKSWQERVFVLGVGFEFLPSGKITGALHHLKRAAVVGIDPTGDRATKHRNASGPCLARSFFLSSNRKCRSKYLAVDGTDPAPLERAFSRW